MSNINHVERRVRLVRPYADLPVGREGVCTADLPDHDVYAVWFDAPVPRGVNWVRFDYAAKAAFAPIEVEERA